LTHGFWIENIDKDMPTAMHKPTMHQKLEKTVFAMANRFAAIRWPRRSF